MQRLILASTSRYRSELLARLGLPFETLAPGIDESATEKEAALALARRLARQKAECAAQIQGSLPAVIVAADQTAALGGKLLRKPGNLPAALEQLSACQGQSVFFHTATTIIETDSGSAWHDVDTTEVRFLRRPLAELARYLELEQPFDCAGGFKAEGLGIALFEFIDSRDPTALIGLPLIWVSRVLAEIGLDPLRPQPTDRESERA
jgi:septum formation protein